MIILFIFIIIIIVIIVIVVVSWREGGGVLLGMGCVFSMMTMRRVCCMVSFVFRFLDIELGLSYNVWISGAKGLCVRFINERG
jgi:hypothetical protein